MIRNYRLSTATLLLGITAAVACLFNTSVPVRLVRAEFTQAVSITGGAPAKRLSTALTTAGYSGPPQMDELTICIPSSNTNTMYLGSSSSVNATTGFALAPNDCVTYRASYRQIDASQFYVFVATTESAHITLRPR